jgi:transcriptional regulator with XRE-family HTH domain
MLRLKEIRTQKNITLDQLAKDSGVSKRMISAYEAEENDITLSKLQNIARALNVSIPELVDEQYQNNIVKGIPYYDIDVTATITESFNDVKESPEFYVDFKPFNDCTAYLPIFGDSMYPTFASGEIIAVKLLNNKDVILWGEAHLVITNEVANNLKTVKLLFPHDDPAKIILRASNPAFKGDTVIPKDSIINIYIVKGKITRKQL